MASTTTELKVQALYVGYLGRAAEIAGRDFWADAIEAGSVTYEDVAADFAQSPEFQSLYSGLTVPQYVDAVYKNVLGRPSDPAGLQFWVDQVQSGAIPADLVVLYMIEGMSATDRVRFDSRVQDGNAYTEAHPNDYVLADAQAAVGLLNELVPTVDGQSATSVNEGQTVQFEFSTIDFSPGSTLNYSITGVSAADVLGAQLSGQVTLDVMNKAIISVTLIEDASTEGVETLSVSIGGLTSSVSVADTSLTPPPPAATYAISASQAGYVEGDTATFNVVTTNVPAGTTLSYVISGAAITNSDVAGGLLAGKTVVDADGKATIEITLAEDLTTEGTEAMTVTLVGTGASASVTIADTSKEPTYSLTADQATVTEGGVATFTLATANVTAGTTLSYTIGGAVVAADIGGPLTGTATVGADGKAYISVPTVSDGISEGGETLQVTVNAPGGQVYSASTTLNDNPGFRLTSGQDGTASQPVQANEFDGSQEQSGSGPVNTLNDTDHLQGVGKDAVLNAVIGNAGGITLVTPSMTDVSTVNVEVANSLPDPVALSLEDTTGTTSVNVTRISGGLSAIVQDMNNEVTSLSAANTVAAVPNIIFDYRSGQAPSTVDLALTDVTVSDLNIGEGAKAGKSTIGTGIDTLNLASNGTNTIGTSNLDGLGSAVTTLNLTVNSSKLTINGLDETTVVTISGVGAGDLFLYEVGTASNFSLAAGAMTGDVTAEIDNASKNSGASFVTGSGNDTLTTAGNLGGDIDTDGGNDSVAIGKDITGSGSVSTGDDSDTVTVGGLVDFGGLIDAGKGNDTVIVAGAVNGDGGGIQPDGGILGGDGGDYIQVGGPVTGNIDGGNDGDGIYLYGGVASTGSVNAGQGQDYVQVVGDNSGAINLGSEEDGLQIFGNNSGSVVMSGGDDYGYVYGFNSGSFSAGADDDFGYISGTVSGSVNMGSGNDVLLALGAVVQTTGGATVDMSDNDDVFEHNFGGGAAITQAANAAVVQGGSGMDAFVARNQSGTYTIGAPSQPSPAVQGFEHMWLTANGGTFNVDLGNVDGELTTIHLNTYDGTAATFKLDNLDDEALMLTDVQASDPGGYIYGNRLSNPNSTAFDGSATVNLNVSSAGSTTLTATLEGPQAFTVNLDDTTNVFKDLVLDIDNATDDQVVNFATVGGDDFTGSTTVTGSAAGLMVTLSQVDSRVVNAKIDADMNIVVGARGDDTGNDDLDREIYTGGGDDVVDFRNAFLDGGDGVTTLGDKIYLGLGTNRLIVGNSTDVFGADPDEPFEDVKGATILEVDGLGTKFFLGDDAFDAGIKVLETTPGSVTTVETGLGFGGFELRVNLGLESNLTLKNEAPANNDLDIRVELDATPTGAGQGAPSDDDATLELDPAGTGEVSLKIKVDDDTPTWISSGAVADANTKSELSFDVDAASGIDQIKLLDNNVDVVFGDNGTYEPGDADNANVYVALENSWATGELTVDASGIDDFDSNPATGAVFIDASSELNADIFLKGSANNNTLIGGNGVNTITGGGGSDVLVGGNKDDTLTGFGGNDVLLGKGGEDTISAGGGNDYIAGGAGVDDLTGGSGSDVFDYLDGTDSSVFKYDVIQDFDFKVDAFSVSQNIELVGAVTIEDQIGAADPGNLFSFLQSRSEIQTAFALPGANAMLVTIISPNFPGGPPNGQAGDVTVMLIENGTKADQDAFDSKDILIELDDDNSYENPGWFSLSNFGPFGNGKALDAPKITGIEFDSNVVGDNVTNDTDLAISGTAADNAVVTLFIDADADGFFDWNEQSWTTTADNKGDWTVASTGTLADGKYAFHAQQTVTGELGGTFISAPSKAENVTIDTTAPTVEVNVLDGKLTAGETTTVLFQFSEPVFGIEDADVDATGANGTLSTLTQVTPSLYSALFTPTPGIEDNENVISFTGAYNDKAGNAGLPDTSDNFIIDAINPGVTITLSDSALNSIETAVVTFQFTEAVDGFNALLDAVAQNGKLSDFVEVDPDTYTATFTPDANVVDLTNVITVPAGSYEDLAGNEGAEGLSANYEVETVVPTVTITLSDDALVGAEITTATFEFSEDVTGFDIADILQTVEVNGTFSNFVTVDANTYTVDFTPDVGKVDATNEVLVNAGSYFDLAGNPGAEGVSPNFTIDSRPVPVVTGANYDEGNNVLNLIGTGFSAYVGGDAVGFQWIFDGVTAYTFVAGDIAEFNILNDTQIQIALVSGTAAAIESSFYGAYGGGNDDLFIDAPFLVDGSALPDLSTDVTIQDFI